MNDSARFLIGFVSMMVCFILPLLLFLRREPSSKARLVATILGLYALWFLTMGPLHEGTHYLGSLLSGQEITGVRLLPHFWRGDFVAFVHTRDMSPAQGLVSLPAPYLLDLLSLLVGLGLLRRLGQRGGLLPAFLLALLCLRPLFDVVTNYLGFVLMDSGDFRELADICGSPAAHAAGIALCGIAIGVVVDRVRANRRVAPQEPAQAEPGQ